MYSKDWLEAEAQYDALHPKKKDKKININPFGDAGSPYETKDSSVTGKDIAQLALRSADDMLFTLPSLAGHYIPTGKGKNVGQWIKENKREVATRHPHLTAAVDWGSIPAFLLAGNVVGAGKKLGKQVGAKGIKKAIGKASEIAGKVLEAPEKLLSKVLPASSPKAIVRALSGAGIGGGLTAAHELQDTGKVDAMDLLTSAALGGTMNAALPAVMGKASQALAVGKKQLANKKLDMGEALDTIFGSKTYNTLKQVPKTLREKLAKNMEAKKYIGEDLHDLVGEADASEFNFLKDLYNKPEYAELREQKAQNWKNKALQRANTIATDIAPEGELEQALEKIFNLRDAQYGIFREQSPISPNKPLRTIDKMKVKKAVEEPIPEPPVEGIDKVEAPGQPGIEPGAPTSEPTASEILEQVEKLPLPGKKGKGKKKAAKKVKEEDPYINADGEIVYPEGYFGDGPNPNEAITAKPKGMPAETAPIAGEESATSLEKAMLEISDQIDTIENISIHAPAWNAMRPS